jgi:UDPglucose 6-dehydrogenase
VRAFDPEGMAEARKVLSNIAYCADAYDAMQGADCLVIVTEWNEFRGLDLARARSLLRAPVMVDLRNVYDPATVRAAGFHYIGIGRGKGLGAASKAEAAS